MKRYGGWLLWKRLVFKITTRVLRSKIGNVKSLYRFVGNDKILARVIRTKTFERIYNKISQEAFEQALDRISDSEELKRVAEEEIRRIKRFIPLISVGLIVVLLCFILSVALVITAMFNSIFTISSVAGNYVIMEDEQEEEEQAEEDEYSWYWEKRDELLSNLMSTGGIYPKDPVLKSRAQLIEVITKSVEDASKVYGTYVDPAWILGSIYRESGNRIYNNLDNNKVSSILTDLVLLNPVCGKSNCSWINNEVSHYYQGVVSSGVDKGDPYTQVINTSMDLYERFGGDHAVGILQFEIPYVYSHLSRMYGNPNKVITKNVTNPADVLSQAQHDSDLGFIRPNVLYVPDIIYNSVFKFAVKPAIKGSNYENIINSDDFRSLSEHNQSFIKFMYASAAYGLGHVTEETDKMAYALIKLAKSGKVEKLDELLKGVESEYWDEKNVRPTGNVIKFINYVNNTYGLGLNTTYSRGSAQLPYTYWYGVYAACVGRVAYDNMMELINAAEKERVGETGAPNGNWIGRPGSGRFGNNNSTYYLQEIGIRWYHQTHAVNQYSQKWGSLKINGTTYKKTPYLLGYDAYGKAVYHSTLASGGCGIYTLAMIASNLLNKDITPDIALAALEGKYQAGALTDAGVPYLANKLGLQVKTLDYTRSDIIQRIDEELLKGNMILFVARATDGKFPWYNGEGHFMALRGITDDGKYLCISSVGNSAMGLSAIDVMKTPLDPKTFLKYLSRNRNYVWVVGINLD